MKHLFTQIWISSVENKKYFYNQIHLGSSIYSQKLHLQFKNPPHHFSSKKKKSNEYQNKHYNTRRNNSKYIYIVAGKKNKKPLKFPIEFYMCVCRFCAISKNSRSKQKIKKKIPIQ